MNDATVKASGKNGTAEIVDNYNRFKEGDLEPHLGKKIDSLIYKEKGFIVFLDEDLFVEWAFTADEHEMSEEGGRILNRVSELQALPISHLDMEHRRSYRMLIGEAVARILDNKVTAAKDALQKAIEILLARNSEIFRWWYLKASMVTSAVICVIALSLWVWRDALIPIFGATVFDTLMCAAAGALGAMLFVVVGSKTVVSESASTAQMHYFQGAAKILGGTLGAVMISLATRTGWLFAPIMSPEHSQEVLWLVSMIAGASERLVPNFVEQAEKKAITKT